MSVSANNEKNSHYAHNGCNGNHSHNHSGGVLLEELLRVDSNTNESEPESDDGEDDCCFLCSPLAKTKRRNNNKKLWTVAMREEDRASESAAMPSSCKVYASCSCDSNEDASDAIPKTQSGDSECTDGGAGVLAVRDRRPPAPPLFDGLVPGNGSYNYKALKAIEFRQCRLNDAQVAVLLDSLAYHPALASLDLSGNRCGRLGLEALDRMLVASPLPRTARSSRRRPRCRLEHLDLSYQFPSPSEEGESEEAAMGGADCGGEREFRLRILSRSCCATQEAGEASNGNCDDNDSRSRIYPSLKRLALSGNRIGDSDMNDVALLARRRFPRLEELDLRFNDITPEGLQLLYANRHDESRPFSSSSSSSSSKRDADGVASNGNNNNRNRRFDNGVPSIQWPSFSSDETDAASNASRSNSKIIEGMLSFPAIEWPAFDDDEGRTSSGFEDDNSTGSDSSSPFAFADEDECGRDCLSQRQRRRNPRGGRKRQQSPQGMKRSFRLYNLFSLWKTPTAADKPGASPESAAAATAATTTRAER